MATFSKSKVRVELTGQEWFALMAHLTNKQLSELGAHHLASAMSHMQRQVIAASNRIAAKNAEPVS